ncbi:rps25 (nucleomorph) [Hemiselmis andersenii]|uniref:40S ribosomal protein S25 n=1 Tax=Hemiselmis andersenii TaxID=464988 RepID=A9BKD1_HEMAN|nr:rps25 [Hemiselmis andersenii]ABW97964.1 rps25 [Hemiselmis andersenii]|mmetsp:Transcript_558/g.1357  ORF Transcript_558/g.1357 Transcript_558/m.1357 type:complete len:89 (+) Transcript_558:56-322(+)
MANQQKKKKWSKGKIKEKSNNYVLIDNDIYEKILKEICKNKIITISNLSERFHITSSLSKKILSFLCEKKILKNTQNSTRYGIYTRNK